MQFSSNSLASQILKPSIASSIWEALSLSVSLMRDCLCISSNKAVFVTSFSPFHCLCPVRRLYFRVMPRLSVFSVAAYNGNSQLIAIRAAAIDFLETP